MYSIRKNVFIDELLATIADNEFTLADFDFNLLEEYIARCPRPERSAGRLLCLKKESGEVIHSQFKQIDEYINEGDLLVFNDTRIIPSRLLATTKQGKEITIFVERILDDRQMLARIFKGNFLQEGEILQVGQGNSLKMLDRHEDFYVLELEKQERKVWELIAENAELAFPSYFQREPTETDKKRFQTIYAKRAGSVSAPSAGFHFDEESFKKLAAKNIATGYVTLHVGSGTSAPIHVDDISKHKMHTEWLEVSPELCEQVRNTKARGKRVIAIGTTSLRALETASQGGAINPYQGYTDIFIRPGYRFQCVDGLFTNLHLPRSTLMILISALAGYENIRRAYQMAIEQKYQFLAYGDGMLIV